MAKFNTGKLHELYGDISFVPRTKGNYGFGRICNGEFDVRYVGRSDSDLQDEIDQQRNKKKDKKYTHFKYVTAGSVTEAYQEECRNYHEYGENEGLDNEIHPRKPWESDHFKCPVKDCIYH